jgi:hypothetical protein
MVMSNVSLKSSLIAIDKIDTRIVDGHLTDLARYECCSAILLAAAENVPEAVGPSRRTEF